MDIFNHSVFDLTIFNTKGKELAKLETLQDSKIYYSEKHQSYLLEVKDCAYHDDLLSVVTQKREKTDMKSKLDNTQSYVITSPSKKTYSLICNVPFCDEQERPINAYIEIPEAELLSPFELEGHSYAGVKAYKTVFKIIPFQAHEHFILHIENSKGE